MSNLFDLPDDEYEAALDKYLPLDRRFTASSVNCFVMKFCDFLNGMAMSAENGVIQIEKKMREVEIKLRFLETQLALIELPPDFKVKKQEETKKDEPEEQPTTSQTQFTQLPPPPPPQLPPTLAAKTPDVVVEKVEVENTPEASKVPSTSGAVLIKDDPKYTKYFKMLKMGVLEQAVKIKMQSEGVDPTFLNRGDEPSPNIQKSSVDTSDSDSVSSFSDSD